MPRPPTPHPDADRPTQDMDPQMLAKLVSEAKPLDQQLAEPNQYLQIDVTTPIDVRDMISLRPTTIPISTSQILSAIPLVPGGTAVAYRGWFRRVWATLTRRGAVC